MGQELRIASGLALPHDAVTQTFAILARKGAGKTYGAAVLAEEMLHAGFQIVVLDPLGVWYGLRSKFPVAILGGDHADIPLDAESGGVVADFVVGERLSVILDVSAFSERGMVRFVGEFGERFYRKNREPVHWFVDEADEFAPQTGYNREAARCLGAMQRIVRRGRARGIGVTLITQRSAVLNKSVLTQTEGLFLMQTTGPQDIKAVKDWIAQNGDVDPLEITREIRKFQTGQAYFYSPGWLRKLVKIKFRKRESFDSSATPKPGKARKKPKTLVEVDIAALGAKMAKTVEQSKADDPQELRKRIAHLEQASKKPTADPAAIDRAVLAAVQDRDTHWREQVSQLKTATLKAITRLIKIHQLSQANGELTPDTVEPAQPRSAKTSVVRKPTSFDLTKVPAGAELKTAMLVEVPGDVRLSKAEAAILRALYWLRGETVTRAKVGFYSGYSMKSSALDKAMSTLRTRGCLAGWGITEEGGVVIAQAAGEKPTGPELREWLRPKIGRAGNAFLDVLIEAHPRRLSKEQVGELSGYSKLSSALDKGLSFLRSIEAAEGAERDGGTKAADVFF